MFVPRVEVFLFVPWVEVFLFVPRAKVSYGGRKETGGEVSRVGWEEPVCLPNSHCRYGILVFFVSMSLRLHFSLISQRQLS